MRGWVTAGLGTAGLLILAACSGSSSTAAPPATTTTSAAGGGGAQHPAELVGDVGHNDAFAISLTDGAGKPITNLAAGTYKLTVKDESGIHDFHLSGAGVNAATDVGGTGTKTFTVTFSKGTYTFVCDPHSSTMHGSFTVS